MFVFLLLLKLWSNKGGAACVEPTTPVTLSHRSRPLLRLSYLRDALGVLFQLLLERPHLVRFVAQHPRQLLDQTVLGRQLAFHAVYLLLEILHPAAHVVHRDGAGGRWGGFRRRFSRATGDDVDRFCVPVLGCR